MFLLVTDYDNCAISPYTLQTDLLAKTFVDHVNQGAFIDEKEIERRPYAAFYGCTHRHFANSIVNSLDSNRTDAYRRTRSNYIKKHEAVSALSRENLLTQKVTANIAKATNLKNLAVSTPDDAGLNAPKHPLQRCGSGFKTILKPFEDKLLEKINWLEKDETVAEYADYLHNVESKHIDSYDNLRKGNHVPAPSYVHSTKNTQLLDIACHAAATYLDTEIVLDFLDDVMIICKNACSIARKNLPENVTIRVYQHDASTEIAPKYMGSVKGTKPVNLVLEEMKQLEKEALPRGDTTVSTHAMVQSLLPYEDEPDMQNSVPRKHVSATASTASFYSAVKSQENPPSEPAEETYTDMEPDLR